MQRDVDGLVRYLGADLGITKGGYLVKNARPGQGTGIRQGGKFYALGAEGAELAIDDAPPVGAIPPAFSSSKWQHWHEFNQFEEYQFAPSIKAIGEYDGSIYLVITEYYILVDEVYTPYTVLVQYNQETGVETVIEATTNPGFLYAGFRMVTWNGKLYLPFVSETESDNGTLSVYDGSTLTEFTQGQTVFNNLVVFQNRLWGITEDGAIYRMNDDADEMIAFTPPAVNGSTQQWRGTLLVYQERLYTGYSWFVTGTADRMTIVSTDGTTWRDEGTITLSYPTYIEPVPTALVDWDGILTLVASDYGKDQVSVWQKIGDDWEAKARRTMKIYERDYPYYPVVFQRVLYLVDNQDRSQNGGKVYGLSASGTAIKPTYEVEYSTGNSQRLMCGLFVFDNKLYAAAYRDLFAKRFGTAP